MEHVRLEISVLSWHIPAAHQTVNVTNQSAQRTFIAHKATCFCRKKKPSQGRITRKEKGGFLRYVAETCSPVANKQTICWLMDTIHCVELKGKGKAVPLQAWTGPEDSRWSRIPDFKTVGIWRWWGCQPGHLYPQEIFLVVISIRSWVSFRTAVWPEGLGQWKIPVTPSGIEPATFRL